MARNRERIPANTKKATSWCLSVWNEWANKRNVLTEKGVDVDRFCVVSSVKSQLTPTTRVVGVSCVTG